MSSHVEDAARQELEQIKALGQQGTQIVAEALRRLSEFTASGRWRELPDGYRSVAAFLAAEFPMLASLAIPEDPRRELVALMAAERTPQKAIAGALGVSQQTVSRDLGFTNVGNSRSDGETAKRGRGRPRKPPASRPPASRQGDAHQPDCPCGACSAARPQGYRVPAPGLDSAAETAGDGAAAGEPQSGGEVDTAAPVPGQVTVKAELAADPGPEPVPCPGCRSRDEHLADVEADRARLAALVREQDDRIAELEADVRRLSERQIAPGPEDPPGTPQDPPEPPDSPATGQDEAPAAQAPGREPCRVLADAKVIFGGSERWVCAGHLAEMRRREMAFELVQPGPDDEVVPGMWAWPGSCEVRRPVPVTSAAEVEDLHKVPA
jgi:hypothetical protein